MALIEDKDDLFLIDRQICIPFHQVIQLLDSRDNDFIVIFIDITLQSCGAVRAVDAVRRETLILFHGLIIEVFAVNHEEDFINEIEFSCESGGFKTGQGFS